MALLFEEKLPAGIRPAFTNKVIAGAQAQGYNPDWLMLVMYTEAGLRPDIVNIACTQQGKSVDQCATGLIQFTPTTAKALGTTTRALQSMDAVTQLDYVFKYYGKYQNNITRFFDLYLATFYPAAIGKPDAWVFPFDAAAYLANKGLDYNKDGKITIAEFRKYAFSKVPADKQAYFANEGLGTVVDATKFVKRNALAVIGITAAVMVTTYLVVKKAA